MNIAIIGGGIAGLSAATVLQELGNHITIFEQHKNLGGMVRSELDKLSNFQEHTPRVFFNNYYNFWNIISRIPIYYQKIETEKNLLNVFQYVDGNYLVTKYGLTSTSIFKMFFNSKLNLLELLVLGFFIFRYMLCSTERLEDDADQISVGSFIKNKEGRKRFEMLSLIMGETLNKLPLIKLVRIIEQNLQFGGLKILKGDNNEYLFNNWELYLRSLNATIVKNRIVQRINQEQNGTYTLYCDKGVFHKFTKIIVATDLWNMIKIFENSNIKLHEHIYELSKATKSNQMGINIYFPNSIEFKTKSIYALEESDWKLIIEPKDNNWTQKSKTGIWTVSIPDDNLYSSRLKKYVKDCIPNEIYEEIWYQIYNSNIFENIIIPKEQIKPSFFKIWVGWDNTTNTLKNKEPYFWNAIGTCGKRPLQNIGMRDIFLAGAYTKTSYYHFWVEGACESGLKCAQLIDYRVQYHTHSRIKLFKLFHKLDKYLYDEYLPNILDVILIISMLLISYQKFR